MTVNGSGKIDSPDVLIMVGHSIRCRYVAIRILKQIPDSVVLLQRSRATTSDKTPPEIMAHLEAFSATEQRYFKGFVEEHEEFFSQRIVLNVTSQTLNTPETVEFIRQLNPRVIAVHSTAIIKPPLIDAFPLRIVNLHAGLSPYYRGSATNVFPIVNREPQYIGMTVHFIDPGIDSGHIILQGRPEITAEDDSHTIGCKNVILGADLMTNVLERYLRDGTVSYTKQDLTKGKLYYERDFTLEVLGTLYQNIDDGVLREYAKNPVAVELIGGSL